MDRSPDEGAIQTLKASVGLPAESLTLERAFLHAEARQAMRSAQWETARDALQRLAAADPEEPWVCWDLAAACRALEDHEGAALAYLTAADKHLARGETDQVLQAYQQAAASSPNDPQIQAKLAEPAPPPSRPPANLSPRSAPPAATTPPETGARPVPERGDAPVLPTPPGPLKTGKRGAAAPDATPTPTAARPPAREPVDTASQAARAPRPRLGSKTETLGQVLQQLGIITAYQLNESLEIQARTG